jgi:hypothetical protein
VSPVTEGVRFSECSFLGNHGNIPINEMLANAGREIFTFLRYFGPEIATVTVTWCPSVHFSWALHPSPAVMPIIAPFLTQCEFSLHT